MPRTPEGFYRFNESHQELLSTIGMMTPRQFFAKWAITQKDLAARLGLDRQAIRLWLNTDEPRPFVCITLALLDCELSNQLQQPSYVNVIKRRKAKEQNNFKRAS